MKTTQRLLLVTTAASIGLYAQDQTITVRTCMSGNVVRPCPDSAIAKPLIPGTPVKPAPTAEPPKGCSGRKGQIEMANGDIRPLQDLCVLNYKSMPGPSPTVTLDLKDGSRAEFPLESISEIQLVDLVPVKQSPGFDGMYAAVHMTLKSTAKGVDGQTTGFLAARVKGTNDATLIRNADDPFVVIGTDPELGGAKVQLRYSQVKFIRFE